MKPPDVDKTFDRKNAFPAARKHLPQFMSVRGQTERGSRVYFLFAIFPSCCRPVEIWCSR
jgi:hypothetical protein